MEYIITVQPSGEAGNFMSKYSDVSDSPVYFRVLEFQHSHPHKDASGYG